MPAFGAAGFRVECSSGVATRRLDEWSSPSVGQPAVGTEPGLQSASGSAPNPRKEAQATSGALQHIFFQLLDSRLCATSLPGAVALHGWDDLIFTHVSAPIPGTGPFHGLIHPDQMQGALALGDGSAHCSSIPGPWLHGANCDSGPVAGDMLPPPSPTGDLTACIACSSDPQNSFFS